ncbi:hypothetical protein [Candidatus Mycoplasma haematominutum]|nr:hypothetical protein [Candidatus Mycoplasma haematominutum]
MSLAGKRLGALTILLGLTSSGVSLSSLDLGRLSLDNLFTSSGGALS